MPRRSLKQIQRNGFFLEKPAFLDALRIRYAIPLERLPTTCVCGVPFDVQHAFSCPKGGLTIHRHNELRDITSEILKEACPNIVTEPTLTLLTQGSSYNTLYQTKPTMINAMYLQKMFRSRDR